MEMKFRCNTCWVNWTTARDINTYMTNSKNLRIYVLMTRIIISLNNINSYGYRNKSVVITAIKAVVTNLHVYFNTNGTI